MYSPSVLYFACSVERDARERVGRVGLEAVLGHVQRHAGGRSCRSLAAISSSVVPSSEMFAIVSESGCGSRCSGRDVLRVRVMGVAARRQPGPEIAGEQLADELLGPHRRLAGLGVAAQRRRLTEQDDVVVGAVAGRDEARVALLVELAEQRRRGGPAVLPLRRQPAGLVGLVPQRPHGDARQRRARAVLVPVGAVEALADRGHEQLELARAGLEGPLQRGGSLRLLGVRPLRTGPGDVEVHADAALGRRAHEVVVAVPVADRVRRRIGGLEAPVLAPCRFAGTRVLLALELGDVGLREPRELRDRLPENGDTNRCPRRGTSSASARARRCCRCGTRAGRRPS